jgi:lipid II:glycine glycyltransferase (peptidoglycan interpeptide bridge formation enzyme)
MTNLPLHPLQSVAWADFRFKSGISVFRVSEGFMMTVHRIPHTSYSIGYVPKCFFPDKNILKKLYDIGVEQKCIFIKLEPNVFLDNKTNKTIPQNLVINNNKVPIVPSPHPLFTKYSFIIDLSKSEEQLLTSCKSKTRYNIKIAQKHGVTIKETKQVTDFESYISLSKETWSRQKFHAHGEIYHRLMWKTLKKAGIARLFVANYKTDTKEVPLVAWIVFLYNNVLYYPYGASSSSYKNVMASNLMMWEVIKWGKRNGAKLFELWGSLGPNPNPKDPWYGFHKFKEGYGGELVEYIGSYDLIIRSNLYRFYNLAYNFRKVIL